jgi:hypothetical protein
MADSRLSIRASSGFFADWVEGRQAFTKGKNSSNKEIERGYFPVINPKNASELCYDNFGVKIA